MIKYIIHTIGSGITSFISWAIFKIFLYQEFLTWESIIIVSIIMGILKGISKYIMDKRNVK